MGDKESIRYKRPFNNNMWGGLIVLVVGVAWLLHQLQYDIFPGWLFRWPMILIALGLAIGAKKRFYGIGWLVMILVGTFFMLDEVESLHLHLDRFKWPVGIIIIGCFLLFRAMIAPSRRDKDNWYGWRKEDYRVHWYKEETGDTPQSPTGTDDQKKNSISDDYIDSVTIFGSLKKRIFSKKFQGADITNFFGGAELDLTQADIEGPVVIDIVQVFGGVKLVIPANWAIRSDVVCIFGGVEDKRPNAPDAYGSHGKVLELHGTCIFGGIDIKSY